MLSPGDIRAAELLSQRGQELLAGGRPAEAVQAFRAAIASNENYFEAHHGLVAALRDSGRLEQSIAAAIELTLLSPNDPRAYATLSTSLQCAGHTKEAQGAADRAKIVQWSIELRMLPRKIWIN
jgi:tetratricopeptide (TPR) repeat protein